MASSPTTSNPVYVALTGNPNCGKTTLFNALTGLRAKVGNYAGVTVERKEGRLREVTTDREIILVDLPGTYSLTPRSLDEKVSRDVLLGYVPEIPQLSAVVVILDASNLERNLYYATQVIELGYPVVVVLNMVDVAEDNGASIDFEGLQTRLGVPVIHSIASKGDGIKELREAIVAAVAVGAAKSIASICKFPAAFNAAAQALVAVIPPNPKRPAASLLPEAMLLLTADTTGEVLTNEVASGVARGRQALEQAGVDWKSAAIEARYAKASELCEEFVMHEAAAVENFSDKLDQILTHKVWGILIFVGVMTLMFQSIFVFARIPMEAMQAVVDAIGNWVGNHIPPGDLNSLIVDGAIAGVGAVVVFLPQILLLFLFIGFLEDTGYMSRAAFLMDRLMSRVGLHGKSFIPMLSSYACAIPGIMATRTIETPKDRLATILVAPLMSCSARLPVYTLLIAACIPNTRVLGVFHLPGLMLLIMYLLGTVVALLMAWLFKKTLLKGEPPMLIMELPPYKLPLFTTVLKHMWDRSKLFLRRAGTVILGINILLWFLATYPRSSEVERQFNLRRDVVKAMQPATKDARLAAETQKQLLDAIDNEEAGEKLRHSFAGRLGRAIEPFIAPLGYDWKIGIGVIASFAAREVFVATMSTVYNVGKSDDSEASTKGLAAVLREQKRPDGTLVYTPLVAVSLMVFYVFALQCVSTVAVVRRETAGWKWPVFQWVYMGVLAWVLAFITYHGGKLLGFS